MSKNAKLLEMFSAYCKQNPEQRFWQALRNWAGYSFLQAVSGSGAVYDTFNWEDDWKEWPNR